MRYISKILIALRPGRKDKNFIAVADRICQFYNANMTLLHVVQEDTNEEYVKNTEENSNSILKKVSSENDLLIIKNNDSIKTISKISAGYDLLIVGTPQKNNWIKVLFGTGKDKFTEKSACSVLRLTIKEN